MAAPARSPLAVGTWRLRWTRQGARANPLQRRLANVVQNFQVITAEGRLENVVLFAPWLRIRAVADCEEDSSTRTGVDITGVFLELGPLRCGGASEEDTCGVALLIQVRSSSA